MQSPRHPSAWPRLHRCTELSTYLRMALRLWVRTKQKPSTWRGSCCSSWCLSDRENLWPGRIGKDLPSKGSRSKWWRRMKGVLRGLMGLRQRISAGIEEIGEVTPDRLGPPRSLTVHFGSWWGARTTYNDVILAHLPLHVVVL